MLTPRDLLNVEFKTSFRGYNEQQVDEFLKKVVAAYEAVYKENQELKAQLEALEAEREEVRTDQRRVDELLELARQVVEDARGAAQREADAILQEARVMAMQEMERARQEVQEHLEQVRQLERQEQMVQQRIRLLLETLLSQLDQPAPGVPAGREGRLAERQGSAPERPAPQGLERTEPGLGGGGALGGKPAQSNPAAGQLAADFEDDADDLLANWVEDADDDTPFADGQTLRWKPAGEPGTKPGRPSASGSPESYSRFG